MTSPVDFAQAIIDATDRIKAAGDADSALAALDALNVLLDDHKQVRMMAQTLCILAELFIEDGPSS